MPLSWREEYMEALQARDQREKASYTLLDDKFIEAYTVLLDRTAALEAEKSARSSITTASQKVPAQPSAGNDGNAQLRSDLAESIRSNGALQARIKAAEVELAKLRNKATSDTTKIEDLTNERNVLAQKVKDRDEELKGKAAFLENVQDELLSLNLQINVSEQNFKKIKAENKELIDRWMARKGREADEMNEKLK